MLPFLESLRKRFQARATTPEPADASLQVSGKLLERVLKELRNSRRATVFRTLVVIPFAAYAAAACYVIVAPRMGQSLTHSAQPRLGVVRIEGVISATSKASATAVIEQLRKGFEAEQVKAIVLAIDSPGGSPVEAERIGAAVKLLQQEHPKPMVSLIGNLGASAGYMIALNSDKIYSHRYSLVGSIGAVILSWNVKELADRLGVKQKAYTSGALKAMLNPFAEPSTEGDAKAQALVQQAGASFMSEVRARRGDLLKANVAYDTGEVWRGEEARGLGLVDGFATLETLSHDLQLDPVELSPAASPFAAFVPSLQALPNALAQAVVQQLSQPAEVQQY